MPPSLLPSAKPLNLPQALAQAMDLHRQGRLAEAEQLYAAILAMRPDHFDALHMLGVLKIAQGQPARALEHFAVAMRAKAPPPQLWLNHGLALASLNRNEEAADSFEKAIKLKSKFFEAHNNRGVVLANIGRHQEAAECYRKALTIKSDYPDALSNLGNALMELKRYDEALKSYDRALVLRPNYAEGHFNRAVSLAALKRFDEALLSYDRAIAANPTFAIAHCNRGVALQELRRYDDAVASYDQALAALPNYPEAHYNRGMSLENLGRHEDAVASYDRALALNPALAAAWSNRGNALRELNRIDEALASYDRAITLQSDLVEALSNRGMILHDLKRYEEAVASYDRALAVQPDHVDALNNKGSTLQGLKRFEEALATFERLKALVPDHRFGLTGMAFCAVNLCDWERRPGLIEQIKDHVTGSKSPVSAFTLLGYSDDPALQQQCARNYLAHKIPELPPPLWNGESWRHDKIRVAYLSADFKSHATAFLMAELFERHDRGRFEVHAISFSADDQSDTRRRLVAAFDRFHDVRQQSNRDVARMMRELEIDIAVDLKGYTEDARPAILSHRPAPIAVNYLGYPGTMGAPFIDYIIGDRFVAPFGLQPYFDEKIVHLPDSYQVNDTRRQIASRVPSRSEVGLPEGGFVFCSFNNNWKITPDVFDVWMRLLGQVEGSMLWLLSDNPGAERNLRNAAQQRGIDANRLVFAGRMPPDEHLARHALADLFLDTLPCNAHTTASDALWAGLPVLTCMGGAFAGRVAGSLVHAARLPELVTSSLDDYQSVALKLAQEPALLSEIKARLARNRMTCPLFNPTRFARHIESAYRTMWEMWQRGEPPKAFAVPPLAS